MRLFEDSDMRVREVLGAIGLEAPPGEIARAIRLARNLSLKEVAQRIGPDTHFTTVGKLETGKRKFTSDWGHLLARVLEVPTFAFYDPAGAFSEAIRIPIYTSMSQVVSHPDAAANTHEYFSGSRKSVFGLSLLGPPDIAGELNMQTFLIDPNAKNLMSGWICLFSDGFDDGEPLIGIYRDDLNLPRIIPWPNMSSQLIPLEKHHVIIGRVFEVRRIIASPHG